jgi:hypothetical protein
MIGIVKLGDVVQEEGKSYPYVNELDLSAECMITCIVINGPHAWLGLKRAGQKGHGGSASAFS